MFLGDKQFFVRINKVMPLVAGNPYRMHVVCIATKQ